MLNPRLSGRYAKSLIGLAVERGELETVTSDMQYFRELMKASREFTNILRSPVMKADMKKRIVEAVTAGKLGPTTAGFVRLLIQKQRENLLPEIAEAFTDQYNVIKKIHRVKLTTAEPVSDELRQSLVDKIKAETSLQEIELHTETKQELIGGFVLEFDNKLVDASILRDLNDIRKQFQNNIYIQNIR